MERLIADRFQEDHHARFASGEPSISEEEIAGYYEAHPEEFQVLPAMRAGVIWIKASPKADPEKRAEIQARAESIREKAILADGAEFNRIVQQHSNDQSTRYIGGDTGWLHRDGTSAHWNTAVCEAARSLERASDVAPLVDSADGFYVVRLTARQQPGSRPLEEVREKIRYHLLQTKRKDRESHVQEMLTKGLSIEINHALLESIPAPASPSPVPRPPALPAN